MEKAKLELALTCWYAETDRKTLISLCDYLGLSIKQFAELESKPDLKEVVKSARALCVANRVDGNQFWKIRASHGRKRIFENPQILLEAAVEWFDWIESNPLYETKVFHHQGFITRTEVPKMRAMTLTGLCLFLDCAMSTWFEYKKLEDFSDIMARIESIIRDQKLTGAAADLLNPNIIARDLGLSENTKTQIDAQVASKTSFGTTEEIEEELKRRGIPIPE